MPTARSGVRRGKTYFGPVASNEENDGRHLWGDFVARSDSDSSVIST